MVAECARWNCYFILFYFLIFGCEHAVFDFEFFLGGFVFHFEFAGIDSLYFVLFMYFVLFCIF